MSMAQMSTLGVRMLSAVRSPNSRADEMSSLWFSSSVPSSAISSIMSCSSSSVTDTGASFLPCLATFWPIHVRKREMGERTFIRTDRRPAQLRMIFSGCFLPMLLGSISAAKKTTIVVIIVERLTKFSPHLRVT